MWIGCEVVGTGRTEAVCGLWWVGALNFGMELGPVRVRAFELRLLPSVSIFGIYRLWRFGYVGFMIVRVL